MMSHQEQKKYFIGQDIASAQGNFTKQNQSLGMAVIGPNLYEEPRGSRPTHLLSAYKESLDDYFGYYANPTVKQAKRMEQIVKGPFTVGMKCIMQLLPWKKKYDESVTTYIASVSGKVVKDILWHGRYFMSKADGRGMTPAARQEANDFARQALYDEKTALFLLNELSLSNAAHLEKDKLQAHAKECHVKAANRKIIHEKMNVMSDLALQVLRNHLFLGMCGQEWKPEKYGNTVKAYDMKDYDRLVTVHPPRLI